MPTINQLPLLTEASSGDQLPVYTPQNGDTRRLPLNTLLEFFTDNFTSPILVPNLYAPLAGFSLDVPQPIASQWMILQPVSTLASGTITLPLNTTTPDGTEVLITSTQIITTLTLGLVDAILRYCGQQPHAQVDPLVQAIRAELAPQLQPQPAEPAAQPPAAPAPAAEPQAAQA
jgi:hypothetical protein